MLEKRNMIEKLFIDRLRRHTEKEKLREASDAAGNRQLDQMDW